MREPTALSMLHELEQYEARERRRLELERADRIEREWYAAPPVGNSPLRGTLEERHRIRRLSS